MALHLVYEAILEPFEPRYTNDLEGVQDRLTGELRKSGTVIVLVYQENETQVPDKEDDK